MNKFRLPLLVTLLLWSMAPPTPVFGQASGNELDSTEMAGTIGSYAVGLNYTGKNHTELVAAHYFYVSQLKNIPLTGSVEGENVKLKGADGSTFQLHFVGNGSNGAQPLTFFNSIGLEGTWTLGGRTLPVKLLNDHGTANPGERLYAHVTEQPDAAYEAMVKGAQRAILAGDAQEASRYITFPLTVHAENGKRTQRIANAAALQAQWETVFTPALLAKVRKDVPHEMFVHEDTVLLGQGELVFGAKGLIVVNQFP